MTAVGAGPGNFKAERDKYVALAFCWGDLLFELSPDLTIAFAAGATDAFVGRKAEALVGTPFRDIIAPSDGPLIAQFYKRAVHLGRIDNEVVRIRSSNGRLLPMALAGYCLDASDGRLFLALRMATAEAKAAAKAYGRTGEAGLYDAYSFAELASHRLKDLKEAGEEVEMTLVALPGMERLRSRLDDATRGQLARELGAVLKAGSVAGDSAAQVAEGKYGIIHQAGADIGNLVGQIAELARSVDPSGEGVAVESATLEAGDIKSVSEEDLAKGILYAMNRFRDSKDFSLKGLSANIGSLVGSAVREVNDFRSVVAAASFDVALQPIVDVHSGDIHHYEALCRFDAHGPNESPYRYITFAEETGLIHDFDLAMVRKVIERLSRYPRNNDRMRLAVNVSGHSVGTASYVEGLHDLLKKNLWTQGKLMFEITESARMSDLEAANGFIQGLRKWGYEVCLDDFGAGAASFQYLSTLDVDVVKLDGSAIRNSRRAHKGRAFLSALTELCRRLGVQTIAEMVDDADGFGFVRDCGCDYVQGYLFGKPSKNEKDFNPLPHPELFRQRRW